MNSFGTQRAAILFILISLTMFRGCSYSFTGASVPPHLKSINIPFPIDRSGSGEADLVDVFNTKIVQAFIDDNTIQIAERANADATLECTVISLSDVPAVVSGGEDVTLRKLTINIKVVYRDLVKRELIFDKNFSDFGNYSNQGNVYDERKQAIEAAMDKLAEDILLSVVSNW